jgi:hypothetical protein
MRSILLFVLVVAGSILPPAARPVSVVVVDDELQGIRDRLTALERTVIRDPFHPKQTLVARIGAVEENLVAMEKGFGESEKARDRDDGSMQRSLTDLKRELAALDRALDDLTTRVKRLEARQ